MVGIRITSTAAASAIAIADANTRQSGAADSAHAPSGSARITTPKPPHASAAPSAPAAVAISSASTISCCVSRRRFAPSAERTANSTDRAVDLSEHQRGDVGARDQEDQRHRAERREQRRPHRADQVVARSA